MTELLSPTAARRVFLILTFTRWFPVGLVVGLLTLLALDRGLSVAQALSASAVSGFVVFALELPTSSFADVFGRRPVYVVAALVNVGAAVAYLLADGFLGFVLASALMGVFRALDSGPLEAWYVDTVHVTTPGADVDQTLARAGMVLGGSIASGSLLSAGLVAWHPWSGQSPLLLPVLGFVLLNLVHVVVVLLLLSEPLAPEADARAVRRAVASAKEAPAVVRAGLGLLRDNRVLRGLVLVEIAWSAAMIVFETFQPIRLAELLGSEARAAAWMGVVAAVGWGVFALGASVSGVLSLRIGVARTAIVMRVLNSGGAVVMGLMMGPVALVAAYFFTYTAHGGGGPVHSALLHREATARNRATVLSMNSMMAFLAFSVCTPLLGLLAEHTSNQVAMVVAGTLSVLGALLYLPALRKEKIVERADAG